MTPDGYLIIWALCLVLNVAYYDRFSEVSEWYDQRYRKQNRKSIMLYISLIVPIVPLFLMKYLMYRDDNRHELEHIV